MPNEHKKWNTINGSLTLNKNNNKNRITPKMKNPEWKIVWILSMMISFSNMIIK